MCADIFSNRDFHFLFRKGLMKPSWLTCVLLYFTLWYKFIIYSVLFTERFVKIWKVQLQCVWLLCFFLVWMC